MKEGRILAIDFGEKRVGLAISVPGVKIAQPLRTIDRIFIWDELKNIFTDYDIETVVVGLPLRTNGTKSNGTHNVRYFVKELQSKFKVPVKLWDERFTTKSAEQILRMSGKRPSRNKQIVDKLAATIILEEYLEWISK
ncbi:MAG: Holliday junction resolvase RuvX [bacterium]|nr:Holliday junction resolvase RuvX [bacterium]